MNCYQKFYTNQIHSSSLLCQLATMWKSQVLCDAIIKSGTISIKAHRVVLVAACPMLQSMENASVGSHLEVRLASDIKEESINTFLQYLYEGFMLLTEENCKDVEKIGRLLQVDNVIKCCADFFKCLSKRTGSVDLSEQYRYNAFNDTDYKHVRSSEMLRTMQDRHLKRRTSFSQPCSPSSKRQRYQGSSASKIPATDDTFSMSQSYAHTDVGDRIPRGEPPGTARVGSSTQPGVIDIVEDSLELVQTDPALPNRTNTVEQRVGSGTSFSVGISSRIEHDRRTQVLNVTENNDTEIPHSKSQPTPPNRNIPAAKNTIPLSLQSDTHQDGGSDRRMHHGSTHESRGDSLYISPLPSLSKMKTTSSSSSSKPFAVGSPIKNIAETSRDSKEKEESSNDQRLQSLEPPNDPGPDIGLVKIEQDDSDLEMYVSMNEEGRMKMQGTHFDDTTNDDGSNETGDFMREESPGDMGNMSGTQDNSWLMDQSQYTGHGLYPRDPTMSGHGHFAAQDLHVLWTAMNTRPCPVNWPIVVENNEGKPFVLIDKESCRFVTEAEIPNWREHCVLTHDAYCGLKNLLNKESHDVHCLESLMGKQKHCILCKYLGRRTKDGAVPVRSRLRCNVCDVALCKRFPRNCFQVFHQLFKLTSLPQLKFTEDLQMMSTSYLSSSRRRSERVLPVIDDVTFDGRFVFSQDEIYDRQNNIIHKNVATESSKLKHCVFCQIYKVKTKSGWRVSTRTKCSVCDVPLCKMNRNCFKMYHKLLEEGIIHTSMKKSTRISKGGLGSKAAQNKSHVDILESSYSSQDPDEKDADNMPE